MGLRPDQRLGLDRVQAAWASGQQCVCLVQPTGAGKTHTAASAMAESAERWLFMVHRDVLAQQTLHRLRSPEFGLDAGVLTGRLKENTKARVLVATVQSMLRRKDMLASFDRVIVDEAHRGEHTKVLQHMRTVPQVKVLGLTATPCTPTGGLAPLFDSLVVGLTYPQAVQAGVILKPVIYAPMRPATAGLRVRAGEYVEADLVPLMHQLMGDVMGAYGKYCAGKRTLIFTVNRAHGKEVRQALEEASQRPLYIDGETPPGERDDILAQWRAERRPLVNIGVFAEGYDEPGIEAVLLANPMKSLARYLQCAGRGCRATPGKANYLLVDCSGSVFDHGSPAAHREWTLEAGHTRVKGKAASFRVCKNCFAVFEGAACELCGTVPSVAPPAKKGVRAELQLIPDSFVPSVDATPKIKDPELEMTDSTRLRRRLYAEMQRQFREPVLTSRVSEAMKSRVVVLWRGASLVLPAHTSLLW